MMTQAAATSYGQQGAYGQQQQAAPQAGGYGGSAYTQQQAPQGQQVTWGVCRGEGWGGYVVCTRCGRGPTLETACHP